jgi:endonuclease III
MRGATDCAKRLKLLFNSMRTRLGKPGPLPAGDPVTQLILGILSRDTPESKASEGLDRLRAAVVDYNELRVVPPIELAELISDFPDARLKCEDISRALNAIFAQEHAVSLDRLSGLPRKEVIAYLSKIDGLEAYTRARIRLLGFQQHAIPLDEAMWATARRDEIVSSKCPLEEAQQFLERQIAEEDAREFVALFKKYAWSEMGAAVRRGEVARIRSIPPDRSTRNMLQMVSLASGEPVPGDADEMTELEPGDELLATSISEGGPEGEESGVARTPVACGSEPTVDGKTVSRASRGSRRARQRAEKRKQSRRGSSDGRGKRRASAGRGARAGTRSRAR